MKKFLLVVLTGICLTAFNNKSEKTSAAANPKSAELARLAPFVGKWITNGKTVGDSSSKSLEIHSSDIYEWAPGGSFIVHRTFGRIGSTNAISLEIIGYDAAEKKYKSHYFGADGTTAINDLIFDQGKWYWQSAWMRGNGVFSPDGHTLTANHEKKDSRGNWVPFMEVTLNKVE